jgi:vesicle-fusing ATPase
LAVIENKASFGVDEAQLESYLRHPLHNYGKNFDNIWADLKYDLEGMVESGMSISTLLLHGEKGSGKTTLACKLAQESGVPFVKILTADALVGRTSYDKVNEITRLFNDAYKSKTSMIILDEIERLIEYVNVGGARYNTDIVQALMSHIKKMPPSEGHRLIVVGTTSELSIMSQFGFGNSFGSKHEIPQLLEAFGEVTNVLNKGLPYLEYKGIEVSLDKNFHIPMRSLIYIMNSLDHKLKNTQNYNADDVRSWFMDNYIKSL